MYKIAFLTEGAGNIKVDRSNPNMRVDLAWRCILDSDHYNIREYDSVSGYDFVFIIWPKSDVLVNSEGIKISNSQRKNNSDVFYNGINIIESLKIKNKKVGFIQEGPVWFSNDYELPNQINHYNIVASSDFIFCHNLKDTFYYKGITNKPVHVIDSVMVDDSIKNINAVKEDKAIIGGNFTNWYGGFNSYLIASEVTDKIYCPSMHNKQLGEENLVNHFPYMTWVEWMNQLSKFRYAIHMMNTAAAGTFSLNCAYFGIPCIGNENIDTQRLCHPELSIDVNNLYEAKRLINRLKSDETFYNLCSEHAKHIANTYYKETNWLNRIKKVLDELY